MHQKQTSEALPHALTTPLGACVLSWLWVAGDRSVHNTSRSVAVWNSCCGRTSCLPRPPLPTSQLLGNPSRAIDSCPLLSRLPHTPGPAGFSYPEPPEHLVSSPPELLSLHNYRKHNLSLNRLAFLKNQGIALFSVTTQLYTLSPCH